MKRALVAVAVLASVCGSAPGRAQDADAGVDADSGGAVAELPAPSVEPDAAQVAVGQPVPLLPGDRSSLPSVQVIGPPECPNGAAFVAETEAAEGRLRLRPVDSGPADYEVTFRRWSGRYDAEIKDTAGRIRSLEGGDCAELARAAGLSLLVLVDAAAELRSTPEPEWTPGGRIPEEPKPMRWQSRVGATAGLGGVLVPYPVVGGYARLSGPVELSTWFLYSASYTRAYGPGTVELGWLGLGSDVCYLLFDLFGFCGGAWVGRLTASGQGYDRNSSVTRWQPGLSFGVRVRSAIGEHWEWGINGSGLVALTRERITVANVEGDAFTTWRLNPLVALEFGAHF